MRVFIMCVGTRDPYWARDKKGNRIFFNDLVKNKDWRNLKGKRLIEGPILSFFKAYKKLEPKPDDKIYLLSTEEGDKVKQPTRIGGDETVRELKKRYSSYSDKNIFHQSLGNVDPSDFQEVMIPIKDKVLEIIKQYGDNALYMVNVSPGTPQMQASWYILVHSGLLKARLYRVVEETVQIRQVGISPLFEEELKKIAIKLFEIFAFKASSDIFGELGKNPLDDKRKKKCEILQSLLSAYFNWDIFKYDEALKILNKCQGDPILNPLNNILSAQKQALSELQSGSLKMLAPDLYTKAMFKFNMGDYVNSLWLSDACCEAILIPSAISAVEEETGVSVEPDKFGEFLKKDPLKNQIGHFFKKRVPSRLGLYESLIVLKDLRKIDHNSSERIHWLRKKRNDIIHPSRREKGINKKEAEKALDIAKETIGANWRRFLESYPFSVDVFKEVIKFANDIV